MTDRPKIVLDPEPALELVELLADQPGDANEERAERRRRRRSSRP